MSETYESWGQNADEFENGTVCVGIDLGTTNSCVAYWKEGANHPKIINHHDKDGGKHKTVPSVVSFPPDGNPFVGFDAVEHEQAFETDTVTVRSAKRLMGKTFVEMADDQKYLSYTLCEDDENVAIDLPSKKSIVAPNEVSAILLSYIKDTAEEKLGTRVFNCVLTVPAYFNEFQRQATLKAAKMAGFQGIRLLNEPTAAAMAYGLFLAGKKRVVIFDFGGGTLDVSVLSIDNGKFAVEGVGGDTHLGGEDINHVLYDFILESVQTQHDSSLTLPLDRTAIIQLQRAVEHAKVALSTQKEVSIYLNDFSGVKSHKQKISRSKLESLCDPVLKKCVDITRDVLTSIDLTPSDIDEVVLVGGSTRIPAIRSKLTELFNGKELCTSVNADEVVAAGAAIQGAILSGIDKKVFQDVLMMDVIPLSIGIEKADGEMEVLIPKNSRIPVAVTKYFDTFEDNQRGITIEVFEGEASVARDNAYLTYFNFTLPRNKVGKAGEFQHPVTLSMNANGVLQVRAGVQHEANETDEALSTKWIFILSVYMAFMAGIYVFVRIYFADDRNWYTEQYAALNGAE
ncbi:Aste57867_17178 [Aphanomyces stellatus]|uniref:Aste57867_17178 protein n=1 Tax=Aphanomyces stellatus TaxID=120398 RepID=A0A485L831_9STRA|nr:hypothetical protein As57867_017119 [Aphanomyces stellatus]VFT93935.1 Aste57867_17178 [Aphanomyces stellatus]